MNKYKLFGLISFLLAFLVISVGCQQARETASTHGQEALLPLVNQQSSPTLRPTSPPMVAPGITATASASRTLPPVGANAGLVIGASVLVLIIIGGVLSARLRSKH